MWYDTILPDLVFMFSGAFNADGPVCVGGGVDVSSRLTCHVPDVPLW